MAGMLDVTFSKTDMKKLQRTLQAVPKAMPKVMSRSLNKTATTVRAESARKLSKHSGLGINVIKKAIEFNKATYKNWVARLGVFGIRIPLIRFNAKQKGTGVKYNIGRKFVSGGFIQTMPASTTGGIIAKIFGTQKTQKQHTGVFAREGKARLPIHELFGPSLGIVLEKSAGMLKKATNGAGALLEKNIDAQVNLILEKGK